MALVVNEDMLANAGLTKQQLDTATWNPTDGGSFEQMVAKLTVDKNGKRGDEPGFDPNNVAVYGLGVRPQRPHLRADDVGRLRRQPRLQAARQEPVGHEVQLRRPALRADLHLVAEHDPQGLHAAAAGGPHARPDRGVPERQGRAGDRRRLDDRHLLRDQGHEGRLLAAARRAGGQLEHVQRARGRDLGRHQAQGGGGQVGQLPRAPRTARASSAPRPSCSRRSSPRSPRRWPSTRPKAATSAPSRPTSSPATRCSTRSPTRPRRST